jgi:PPOX class probable F420-dependent enzyme
LIPESHVPVLQSKAIAHLATMGPDGELQSTPVWFDWDGERLILNTNKWRQKYRNIMRHPRVAVSMTNPDSPFSYLEFRGTAEVEDDPDQAVINSLSRKYLGTDYQFLQPGEERVTVRVKPEHVTYQ